MFLTVTTLLRRLAADENSSATVEYTVLLAILTIATVVAVALVGSWISSQWVALHRSLQG